MPKPILRQNKSRLKETKVKLMVARAEKVGGWVKKVKRNVMGERSING